jgi:diaminohydroxyphosphoribosylaminopyrimidine deaminase/5-amino-6-(5-phosphoribosylamino)uracil reductase
MTDTVHMRRALELARSAEGAVSPRPPVGAVIVAASGEVVGRGATTARPGPHAEIVALEQAGGRARGATAYVTLEPCAHHGATPPCADALVAAGVARVVAGVRDPFPQVRGRGFKRLRDAGIELRTGVLRQACREMVRPFATWAAFGRPYVTLKLAATLDGKVAAPDGTSRWITGESARAEVHALRGRVDAVVVGAGTIETDDPSLTCRSPEHSGSQPRRVVVDSSGRTPATARIFDGEAGSVVLTALDVPDDRLAAWEGTGATVVRVPRAEAGASIPDALRALGQLGICHVLLEGGPGLAASFAAEGVVDRYVLYLAPKLLGGEAYDMLGVGAKTLAGASRLRIERVERIGDDLRIEAVPAREDG